MSSRSLRSRIVALVALVTVAGVDEAMADNPARRSRRCRNAIASSVRLLAATSMRAQDRCLRARDRGEVSGDCNQIAGNIDVRRAQARAEAKIAFVCPMGDPVRLNYPDGDIEKALPPAVVESLEGTGGELLGSPVFQGDGGRVRDQRSCHAAISSGRENVTTDAFDRAVACQRRLDKRASSFGPIDPSCLVASGRPATQASRAIARTCAAVSGVVVGSCAALPGCVVDEANASGQELARLTYGGPTTCGNGVIELGETCDDGNSDAADTCTNACEPAACGDAVVQTGVEQCDDGNDIPDDSCDNCRGSVCGDGRLAVGVEECDDGNDVPNDGGTGCQIDPTLCGTGGMSARVATAYEETSLGPIAGFRLALGYPGGLNLPFGLLGFEVESLTGVGLFVAANFDTNGDGAGDTVRTTFANATAVPAGDFESVLFACTPGTPVRPRDFACALSDVSSPEGLQYPAEDVQELTSCSVTQLAPAN